MRDGGEKSSEEKQKRTGEACAFYVLIITLHTPAMPSWSTDIASVLAIS